MGFIVCLTVKGNEDLLKWEVSLRGLDWRLSFSRPGLVSFKGEDVPRPLAFAMAVLPMIAKVNEKVIDSDSFHYEEMGKEFLQMPNPTSQFPWWNKAITAPEYAPSRAYSKIAEASIGLEKLLSPPNHVLELGSAPGGASLFLIERGLKVTGVDPAEMSVDIQRNSHFRHWKMPVQKLKEHLRTRPDRFEILVSDLNLGPRDNIKWVMELVNDLRPTLKKSIVTLKANREGDVKEIVNLAKSLGESAQFRQLPSHHRETCLIL